VSIRKTGRRAVTAPRPIKAERWLLLHADEIICGLPRAHSCFFLCLLDHSARHSAPHCRAGSRNGHLRWHSVHCGAVCCVCCVCCVLWPGENRKAKSAARVVLPLACSYGRVCLCSPVLFPTSPLLFAPTRKRPRPPYQPRSFPPPASAPPFQAKALTPRCASGVLPYLAFPATVLPYNSTRPPTLSLSQLLFHLQSQKGKPTYFGRPYRQSVSRYSSRRRYGARLPRSPLSPPPLSSGISVASLALKSRFGVIGIYHGCSVYILDSIFLFCSHLLRLDFSTLQSLWLLTILKAFHLEGALFLLVDRVGRLRSSGASPPVLHPHQHQTQVKSRC